MVKYYSTQRPIVPDTFPQKEAVKEIKNFDERIFCEEIGREAWGWIEYSLPLTKKEADLYELVLSGIKRYYCVTTSVKEDGRVVSAITNIVESDCKPESISKSLRSGDVYNDWFDSIEEATEFIREARIT